MNRDRIINYYHKIDVKRPACTLPSRQAMRENPLPQRNCLFLQRKQTRKINCPNCPKCPSCQNRWYRIRRIALFTGLLSSTPETTWHGASIPRPFEGELPRRRGEGERLGSWEIAQSLERMEQRGKGVRSRRKGGQEQRGKEVKSSEQGRQKQKARGLGATSKGDRSRKQWGQRQRAGALAFPSLLRGGVGVG